ncbi:ricin-type beta-trefoil lectin domain protein [Kitasatospora sp. NPDC058170]|uniref:ricin-type beta-trefoil lectin domain protein n=1 Tax=Kitasatospora sp. NPDC058170 TaxID=3346364 RepID=UPI0036DB7963
MGAAGTAFADDRPFAVKPAQSTRPEALPTPPPGGPLQAARLKAKATGKPVTVDELTTESSLTVAEPDGKVTLTTHLQAARVRKADAWTPVDAGLARNQDGSWSPRATPSGVALSGGGTGPLATLTDKAGRSLALTFPVTLPKPTVSGSGARYPEVLPGVDLQVDVTDQGAVREVLVVKDAKAAADPRLASLRLTTSAKDLTVSADEAGGVTARAADGTAVFSTPAPVMWDSATAAPAAAAKPEGRAAKSAPGAAEAAAQPAAGPAQPSSTDGPGDGAKIRPIGVRAEAGALTLTPDAGLLAGEGTTWPLYIDPTFTPTAPMGTNHFVQVMEGCPSPGSQLDKEQPKGQGAGYQQYQDNCFGMERSYYEFDTSALNSRMYIAEATAYFYETYGANHDCNAEAPVTLKWMKDAIGSGTNWLNQPRWHQDLDTKRPKSAYCSQQPVNFDVTGAAREVAQGGIQQWTLGLFGDETRSAGNYGFMRFNKNPYIQAKYDIAPNTPDSMDTSPASQNPSGPACGGGQPGWIGMTTLAGDASNITLNAYASTPMSGNNLVVGFHTWDNMVDDGHGNPSDATWRASEPIGSAGWGRANIGGRVSDGHQYGWNAWASDGLLDSPGSAYCYFNVDLTAPSLAQFTPLQSFPPLGSGLKPTAHAGDQGVSITVSSNDPTPGGCTRGSCIKSGVRGFQYALDDNIPPVGANFKEAAPDADGTAVADIPINLPRDQWGTHRLYVRAVDGAGNTQPEAAVYDFYAPWNPANKVIPGDVSDDGTPDFLAPDSQGNLTLLPGNADVTAAPVVSSAKSQSPEHDSWNNYLIAHRGSVTERSVDDLIAYNKGTHKLYAYLNDASAVPAGTPGHFSLGTFMPLGVSGNCASGIDGTWDNITQLVSPGAYGNPRGLPNVITVENNLLRFYVGDYTGGCRLSAGVTLGDGDWSGVTLLTPGTVGGTPTLWARDNVTGAVLSYPLAFGADGTPTGTLHAPVHRPLVSAVKDAAGANMCADVDHGWTANGTTALLWNCAAGSPNQQFTLGADGLVHVLGKCLDIRGEGTDNGSDVVLWDCSGGNNQKWEAGTIPGTLRNPVSGRCLGVPDGLNTPGNHLIIWDCSADVSQKWDGAGAAGQLTPQAALTPGFTSAEYPGLESPGDVHGDGFPDLYATGADGRLSQVPGTAAENGLARFGAPITLGVPNRPTGYHVRSAYDGGKCLDHYGPMLGHDVAIYDCWNGVSQKFTFAPDGTLRAGGYCVGVRDNGIYNGSSVAVLDCLGEPGQQWTLRSDGSLFNPNSKRCLEIPGWDNTNGRSLDIWDCITGNRNQLWNLSVNTA